MQSKNKYSSMKRSAGSKNRPGNSNRNVSSKRPSSTRPSSGSKSQPPRQITSSIGSTSTSRPKTGKSEIKSTIQPSYSTPTSRTTTTGQSDAMASRLAAARANWDRVAGGVALASMLDALENVSHNLDALRQKLGNARARGYRFGRDWESKIESLQQRWPEQRLSAMQLLDDQRQVLQNSAREVEMLLQRAARDAGLLGTAEMRISGFQSSISTAESRIRNTFDSTSAQTLQLQSEVDNALFLLESLDSASFDMLPDEHGIAACKAIWTSDAQQPEGLLFLTDARLIFEQRQEVATKKVLFVTTQKKLVQEMLWDSPIGAVDELESEDQKAFLRRKEILTLRFSERTRDIPSDVTLQLVGADNEVWTSLIRRAKSGQIDAERFGAPPPEEQLAAEIEAEVKEPEKELPTQCPKCNAPLPAVFKGMKQLECDYCGATINI
jgi:hypothetical protein